MRTDYARVLESFQYYALKLITQDSDTSFKEARSAFIAQYPKTSLKYSQIFYVIDKYAKDWYTEIVTKRKEEEDFVQQVRSEEEEGEQEPGVSNKVYGALIAFIILTTIAIIKSL